MGVVWKAVDTMLGREVAIKFLPAAFAADQGRLARFEREARVLASLTHPNVAGVYGLHEVDGVRFLAMELVRGRSLTDEIQRGLAPTRMVELALAIADGLAAAHRQGVVHRDLKPDNVMIDGDGRPKILDFGLAKTLVAASEDAPTQLRGGTTRQGTLVGTVAYMSPEQAQGEPVDLRSDVFSLGIVLYEMATGRQPFTRDNAVSTLTAILRDTTEPVTSVAAAAPPPLDGIVARCLEKHPARRYDDASGVRDDLRALQTQLVSVPSGIGLPSPAKRLLLPLSVLTVIGLSVLGVWWVHRSGRQRWVRQEALPQLQGIVDRIDGQYE